MKKLTLALALAGLSAAAFAQTSTQVYGVVDMGMQRNFSSARTGLDSGLQSESRIGFRGQEDLGNGTSAIFGLEAGFQADNGANSAGGNSLFSRQSYVGLQGPLGTVKLGRQMAPIYGALYEIDPFQVGLAGNASNIFNDGGRFTSNSVSYANTLGPISGSVLYGLGNETPGNYLDGRTIGASASVGFGPVKAVLGYHAVNALGDRAQTVLLGGTADLTSGIKVHGAFADNKGLMTDSRDYMVGVTAKATSVDTFLGSVAHKDDRTAFDNNATQYAIGWTHAVSQRTNLYTSYGYTKFTQAPTAQTVNVGIRHLF